MIGKSKKHLNSVSESYFQHMAFAFKFGFSCILAGLMAIIHGICPALFVTTASERVAALANRGNKRRKRALSVDDVEKKA